MIFAGAARQVCLALMCAGAVLASGAGAHAASRVVLLRATGGDPLSRQATTLLRAELHAFGFDVAEVDVESVEDRTGKGESAHQLRTHIASASARLQAVATFAIRSIPGGTAVELWLEDRLTGKLVIRRVDLAAGDGAAADLAVKAVELLRGSLLEVTVQGRTDSETGARAPLEVRRFVADAARAADRRDYFGEGIGLSAGAAVLGGVGLGTPAYSPLLRLSWGHASGHLVRVTATGLGSSPQLHAVEGTADVYQSAFLAEVVRVFRPAGRLQPLLGGGAGVHRVRSAGRGVSSLFPDGDATTYAPAVGAILGIAARLGNRLALVVDMELLASLPRTSIVIANREVARAGGLSGLLTASFCGVF